MTKSLQALPVIDTRSTLGEGPLWHSKHELLYWVDIEGRIVHGFHLPTKEHRQWVTPKRVGTVAGASNGKLILGLQGEVAELDPFTSEIKTLLKLESDIADNRCNDGKCDPAGRFWVGTMELETKPERGALYCIDTSLKVHQVLTGLTIANGMGWSPNGNFMYFIDSADYAVRRYHFSPLTTSLERERIVLRFENDLPDGMCVDSEGMLWIGFWGAGRVGRYDPKTGRHLADIKVPAPQVTSCCFGGKDLRTLYITTARAGLSEEQIKEFPLSGSLFVCEPGIRGLEANSFLMPAQLL